MGVVTQSADGIGISRHTFYNWMKIHPEFKEMFEEVNNYCLDMAESMLYMNIRKGKEASIFFYLKCRGKGRGYVEKEYEKPMTPDELAKAIISAKKEMDNM